MPEQCITLCFFYFLDSGPTPTIGSTSSPPATKKSKIAGKIDALKKENSCVAAEGNKDKSLSAVGAAIKKCSTQGDVQTVPEVSQSLVGAVDLVRKGSDNESGTGDSHSQATVIMGTVMKKEDDDEDMIGNEDAQTEEPVDGGLTGDSQNTEVVGTLMKEQGDGRDMIWNEELVTGGSDNEGVTGDSQATVVMGIVMKKEDDDEDMIGNEDAQTEEPVDGSLTGDSQNTVVVGTLMKEQGDNEDMIGNEELVTGGSVNGGVTGDSQATVVMGTLIKEGYEYGGVVEDSQSILQMGLVQGEESGTEIVKKALEINSDYSERIDYFEPVNIYFKSYFF